MQQSNASSMIFPHSRPLPEVLGQPRLRQEVLQQIYSDSDSLFQFNQLAPPDQEALLEFCIGNRSLKVTYDPFFNNLFHPVNHPKRLSRFLSSVLKQPVTVKGILSREGTRLSAEASLMVMDILVELADGSLINVEMQKVGYNFPIERVFCYGADLLVRQYDRIRDLHKKEFTYRDMRPVYTIVLMERSPAIFSKYPDHYIHRSSFQLDSGLPIDNLLNFTFVCLDIFMKMPHNKLTELEAWLYFLGSDNPLHIQRIIEKYPFFKELYKDIINLRYHPKELITMFSESLLIADHNTVKLMIDEMKQEIEEQKSEIAKNNSMLAEQNSALAEKDTALAEKDSALAEKDSALAEKDSALAKKDAEIARLNALLAQKETQNS